MQISAGLTLGLLAWDANDRPAALKRYREALDLAAQHPKYEAPADAWERYIQGDIKQIRCNLTTILENDEEMVRKLAQYFGIHSGVGEHRKDVLGIGYTRIEADGRVTLVQNAQIASDKCASCGRRNVKLMKCSAYCDAACQRADWKKHKLVCASLKS
ncbi:hypothetical protein MPER_07601 [Moniliophthora perniciosa FA553]|nr:hypothetical protein MPER_07601 [Moniliophthora perniciosa FA553]